MAIAQKLLREVASVSEEPQGESAPEPLAESLPAPDSRAVSPQCDAAEAPRYELFDAADDLVDAPP